MTTTTRPTITEATAEKMADRLVQARLATDSGYLHAADANAQYSREERISMEVWAGLEDKYEISG